jgi:uncharacterized protein with HEPN domain
MNESDLVRLRHMLEYALEVIEFAKGHTLESVKQNRMLVRALCYSTGIIGEAASKVSQETRDANPQISWRAVIGMRNFLFHVYFNVDYDILWKTATEAVPALIVELEKLLDAHDEETNKNDS